VIDAKTGQTRDAYVFVAVLGVRLQAPEEIAIRRKKSSVPPRA
jgi:hypothetical protein